MRGAPNKRLDCFTVFIDSTEPFVHEPGSHLAGFSNFTGIQ